MRLLLVRHGESEANARRQIQGWLDSPLSALGREQARAAAARLAGVRVAAVYASTLRRAAETAAIIAEPHGLDVIPVDDLREYDYGAAQGLTWDEVQARWPQDAGEWGAGHIPGEEGAAPFAARAVGAFESLRARHEGETVIAVSHGGTMGVLVSRLLGLAEGPPRLTHANAAITTIAHRGSQPIVEALNERCHVMRAR